jgi:hypothetical protein
VRILVGVLIECLEAGDHARRDLAFRGFTEIVRKDLENQSAPIGMERPIMFQKNPQTLGYRPNKLAVGQLEK